MGSGKASFKESDIVRLLKAAKRTGTKVRFKLGALEVETLGATATTANNQEASVASASAADDPDAAGVAMWDKLVAENEKPPGGGTKEQ
jgi:hypothetical protein